MIRLIKTALDKLAHQLLKPLKVPGVVLLGLYTGLWGLWVGNPFWTVFDQATIFSSMDSLMPEWIWGLFAIGCGALMTYAIIRKSYLPLVISAALTFWFWSMVSAYYFAGDWRNTGGISAAAFAIYASFIWLNLRVNKKVLGLDNKHAGILMGEHFK